MNTHQDVDWQDSFSSSNGYTQNFGQFGDPSVLFYASGPQGSIAFEENSILLNIKEPTSGGPKRVGEDPIWGDEIPFPWLRSSRDAVTYGSTVRLSFDGADGVAPEGRTRLPEYRNYFLGNDPTLWSTRVPSYREVVYEDIYQGIDLVYREEGKRIKYEYIIDPGADPTRIQTGVEGHDSMQVKDSNLVITTRVGLITDSGLDVFYMDDPEEKVNCEFELFGHDAYGFRLSDYDHSRTLVIDPFVASTYLGGDGEDLVMDMVLDSVGDAYLIGYTDADDFPTTPESYESNYIGGYDIFITKVSNETFTPVFSTYLGGHSGDIGWAITVDDYGNIYGCGWTGSNDFPTTDGVINETQPGDIDGIIFKLNATGDRLVFSSFFGSDGEEIALDIALGDDGGIFFIGTTNSENLTVTDGASQMTFQGGYDSYVCKLNPLATNVTYSTFLGGEDVDEVWGIEIDGEGNAFVCGWTESIGFPNTSGAFQSSSGGGRSDAFVTKINPNGTGLVYSTYLGGSGRDRASDIVIGDDGTVHVLGRSSSDDFPTTAGVIQRTSNGNYDIFISRLDQNGTDLVSSTFFGGSNSESGQSICLDDEGNVTIGGYTGSDDITTTTGAVQEDNNGDGDGLFFQLSADYSRLLYSTYFGGSDFDGVEVVGLAGEGYAIAAGYTISQDFPITSGAFQPGFVGGLGDAFILKLAFDSIPPVAIAGMDVVIYQHETVLFNGSQSYDNLELINWTWSFQYLGKTILLFNETVNFTFHEAGEFLVELLVRDAATLNATDTLTVTVLDITPPLANAGPDQTVLQHTLVSFNGGDSEDNVGIMGWSWNFTYMGNDVLLFGPTPNHTFDESGHYPVSLRVNDLAGYSTVDVVNITVTDITIPTANAGQSIVIDQDDTVIFNGSNSRDNEGIVRWEWSFESDGEPVLLDGQGPSFLFEIAGEYHIILTVWDASGNSDTDTTFVTVRDTTDPIADAGDDVEVNEGTTVQFDGSRSDDNVAIVAWVWSFDYKGIQEKMEGRTPHFYFEYPGEYIIELAVADDQGRQDTDYVVVRVKDISEPQANAGSDKTLDQHSSVTFKGSSSEDNVDIISWEWTFEHDGDDIYLEGPEPTFTFTQAGTFTVTLTVRDAAGNEASDEMEVRVNDITDPVPDPGEDRTVDQGSQVRLDGARSTDNIGIDMHVWKFEYDDIEVQLDGTLQTYTFQIPGEYTIQLTVTDIAGNYATDSFILTVQDTIAPVPVTQGDLVTDAGSKVTLDGAGSTDNLGIVKWTWTFRENGKDVMLEGVQVDHAFEEAGEYDVTLTVEDAGGNTAVETFTVTVEQSGLFYWILLVVAAVIIVTLTAFVVRRRSSGSEK